MQVVLFIAMAVSFPGAFSYALGDVDVPGGVISVAVFVSSTLVMMLVG